MKQLLAQFSETTEQQRGDAEQVVFSDMAGQLIYTHIDLLEQSYEKYEDFLLKSRGWGKVGYYQHTYINHHSLLKPLGSF